MRKPNPNSILLNLPEAQQAQLAEWMLGGTPYWKCRDLIREQFQVEPPRGDGSFSSFWWEVCQPALLARRRRAVQTSDEIAAEAQSAPGRFDQATIDQLKQQAFELSIRPNCNPKDVKAIFSLVLKARDQENDAEQLKLDRDKFEFLKAQAEKSKAVISNSALTAEEKEAEMKRILGMT